MNATIHPNPKKQDLRHLYKKKRFIIPVAFLGFCFILGLFGGDKEKTTTTETIASAPSAETTAGTATTTDENSGGMSLKTKIQNTIKSIDGGDNLTANKMEDAMSFTIAGSILKAYSIIIKEGRASTDPDVLSLVDELEKKTIASQKKNYPKLRKAYYEFIKKEFATKDVKVGISGSDYSNLSLTNDFFASNDNAMAARDALVEMLQLLRFKEVSFCAYQGQDDCISQMVLSPADDEIES